MFILFYPVLKETLSETVQLYFKKLKETKAAYFESQNAVWVYLLKQINPKYN